MNLANFGTNRTGFKETTKIIPFDYLMHKFDSPRTRGSFMIFKFRMIWKLFRGSVKRFRYSQARVFSVLFGDRVSFNLEVVNKCE